MRAQTRHRKRRSSTRFMPSLHEAQGAGPGDAGIVGRDQNPSAVRFRRLSMRRQQAQSRRGTIHVQRAWIVRAGSAGVSVRQDRHLPLRDDFATVHAGVDKVDSAPASSFRLQTGLRPCLRPGNFGRSESYEVMMRRGNASSGDRLQDLHEAGENTQLTPACVQQPNELLDLWLKLRSEPSGRKEGMGNAECARNLGECRHRPHPKSDDPDVCRQVTGADLLVGIARQFDPLPDPRMPSTRRLIT